MRWKSMFITIVLNIFVMLAVSVLFEYINLSERFISLEDSVQEALDSAIDASTKSEEFFSAQYQQKLTSVGTTRASANTNINSSEVRTLLWLDDSKKFYKVNSYLLAYYYFENDKLPETEGDINVLNNYGCGSNILGEDSTENVLNGQTGFIYEWLYGAQGSDYNNPSLEWADRNPSKRAEYESLDIERPVGASGASENFYEYYKNVGRYQLTTGYLKQKDNDGYNLVVKNYPTLMNMGYEFMSDFDDTMDYTSINSHISNDNFVTTYHIGKSLNGNFSTYYYLTPASLGVTYVPVEVLKPIFVANLDTVVRLNYIGGASTSGHTGNNIANASHCVATDIYDSETGHVEHDSDNEDIVTDGLVEFDLNSAQVKVDYFQLNFDDNNVNHTDRATIISKINGAVQAYSGGIATRRGSECRDDTLSAFTDISNDSSINTKDLDSSRKYFESYDKVRNSRIIARVSVKIKVHVPYKSAILQWMCNLLNTSTKHFDIKMWDKDSGSVIEDSDGVWYQYTTYYCTSRA